MSDLSPDGNPLSEAHLTAINAALEQAVAARKAIDLAVRAGLNMDVPKARLDADEAQLRRIKQVYFPNR